MLIVDTALRARLEQRNPIRVAMVGAGYMGSAIALQILTAMPSLRLVAIANRTVAKAEQAYRDAGATTVRRVVSVAELERAMEAGEYAVTDDASVLCETDGIEAIIETTCDFEVGARVALDAISHGKHVVLMNAEVDSTVGPILKVYADRNNVVYTYTDGDEPGVAMNLFRFVDSIGYRPVLMGQIKGFLDHYRNPETQREFAQKHGQKPAMVASYADGSKLAIESAILGNATGFRPQIRGMHGHRCAHVDDLTKHFSPQDFAHGGLVDYVLGSAPHTGGAFVVGFNDHPVKRQYMSYFKLGPGPLYVFYRPYHLPHLELPLSVARAVLFHDATITPRGAPVCDAVTFAKRDLKKGETLDGMGGFTCYGLVESYETSAAERHLPIVLNVGCKLLRDIPKDAPIGYDDVILPAGRLCDRLRAEQTQHFSSAVRAAAGS
jgi:predicted homoserine dehydrogenase-like protein